MWWVRACLAVAALAALAVLWHTDPMQAAWLPKCPVRVLTGWQCPGCGITRATHALLHGRVADALSYNWFFVVSVPYLLSVCAVSYVPALRRRQRLRMAVTGPAAAWVYATLFTLWFVTRNILDI